MLHVVHSKLRPSLCPEGGSCVTLRCRRASHRIIIVFCLKAHCGRFSGIQWWENSLQLSLMLSAWFWRPTCYPTVAVCGLISSVLMEVNNYFSKTWLRAQKRKHFTITDQSCRFTQFRYHVGQTLVIHHVITVHVCNISLHFSFKVACS